MPRPAVAVLCALYAGATALLAFACLFPLSPTAPVGLGLTLLPIGVFVTALLWVGHRRVTDGILLAASVLLLGLMSVLLAAATTPVGVVVNVVGFGWLIVYVAVLLPNRAAAFSAATAVAIAVAVAIGGVGGVWPALVVLVVSMLLVAAVLGRLSRSVQQTIATDPLTGALNRAGLRSALDRLGGRAAAVAMIDLDAFKAVNDDLGHHAGDRLLAEAARAWLGVLRHHDMLARTGGDEFALVMPDTTVAEARGVVERLRAAHPVAFSAGVAGVGVGGVSGALEDADRELYAVKRRRDARLAGDAAVSRRRTAVGG